ncbi:MAG: ferritin-like domain-containing protein [Deltaproteobacteria bacterium]|nr:ferritin-like domain-containing protein [Deltaproteobacteria bacterium]
MEPADMLHRLKALVRLDIDAFQGYDRAIREVDHPEVRERLWAYRGDHLRHVFDLSAVLREHGEEPPSAEEVTGVQTLGFVGLLGGIGPVGALEAMRTNETLVMTYYEEARSRDFPPAVKAILERNFRDEARHLSYVAEVLRTRPWE